MMLVQEPNDLRFQVHPQAKFDVRAAVLLVHAGQLLVTVNSASCIALVPGGAVKFGGTAAEAAAREIRRRAQAERGAAIGGGSWNRFGNNLNELTNNSSWYIG